jgi:hypothetical protein
MTRKSSGEITCNALSQTKTAALPTGPLEGGIYRILLSIASVAALSGCIPYGSPSEYPYARVPYYPTYVQQPYQQQYPFVCDSECQNGISNGLTYDKSQNFQYTPNSLHPEGESEENSTTQKAPPAGGPKVSIRLAECLANAIPEIDPDSSGEGAIVVFMTRCKTEYQDYMSNCMNDRSKKECNEMVGATVGLLLHFQDLPDKKIGNAI